MGSVWFRTHVNYVLPGHGLSGEELQLVVVQTEMGECEETSEGLCVQVVQRVVTETKPLDVLQTLRGPEDQRTKFKRICIYNI